MKRSTRSTKRKVGSRILQHPQQDSTSSTSTNSPTRNERCEEQALPFTLSDDVPEEYRQAVTEQALKMYNYGIQRGDKPWCLNDFEIGCPLGTGKFGRVYLARDKVCHSIVAMKVIYKSEVKENTMEHQVVREIEIQSRLKHPHIIQLLTYFSDEKRIFLILEYAAEGDLFTNLQNAPLKRFPENLAAKYIYQVADALHYCHQMKVIHRDIKPENLLLGLDGNVKVSDFGYSVHANSLKRKTMCGTLGYLAPEMLQHKYYNELVDNWCLGVLCYQFLVGNPPFESESKQETVRKTVEGVLEYPSYVSHDARDFISRLLKKSMNKRMSLPDAMKHPWVVSRINAIRLNSGNKSDE